MAAERTETTSDDVRRALRAAAPSRLRRVLSYGLLAAAVAGAGYGVWRWRHAAATRGPTYEEAEVRRADLRVTVTATGTLQALTTVDVGAEVTGKVLEVTVEANAPVKKGQVLAIIDPEQLRASTDQSSAQVAQAEAAILQAQATLTEATLALERSKSLLAEGLVGQGEYEAANANKLRAEASVANARASATLSRAALKLARSRLDRTRIFSPIDGIVLSRLVEPGQTVTAGFTTPILFRLAQDLTQMRLTADVDEADVGRVKEGQTATFTVEAYPDRNFDSRVVTLRNEPKTTQNVVTYQAVLAVDNKSLLLRPGMTCTATIVAETHPQVLVVPNAALRFYPPTPSQGPAGPPKQVGVEGDQRKQHVWLLEGTTPKQREVRLGASDGSFTELLSTEFAPGTKVIVDVSEAP
jgi:HlyD family secretion protein